MEYLKVFTDFAKVLEPLGDAEIGRLFIAMLEYTERGAEPDFRGNERFIWPTAKLQIDRTVEEYNNICNKNRENGKKGGRPKNPAVFEENPKNPAVFLETQKSQDKDKDKDKDKDNISPKINKKPPKHKYGKYSNVLLSDDDLAALKAEFSDWEKRIERLSEYKASTGKVYKNDLATIRNWARRDGETKKEKPATSYDMDVIRQRFELGNIK